METVRAPTWIRVAVVTGLFFAGMCGEAFSGEQVMDNGKLTVTAASGASGVVVSSKAPSGKATRLELVFRGKSGQPAKLGKVGGKQSADGKRALHVVAGDCQAELTLGKGETFVTVSSSTNGCSLEVRATTCYTVLPDLFGYDLVYDPARFKGKRISVPAENFLINLIEGNNAMVMCVWPGSLNRDKDGKAGGAAAKPADRDPLVELLMDGQGATRRVTAARIEFAGGPIHVAVMEYDNLWHAEDVSEFEVQKPTKIKWKRPFDAQWRVSTVVAEGKQSKDLMTRSQSYELLYRPADLKRNNKTAHTKYLTIMKSRIWQKGYPQVYEERTYQHIYPAWFDKEETWLAMYTDNPRAVAKGKKESSKENNIYDLTLFYPLDRGKGTPQDTPLEVFTPIDIMRATLGQEPCEYILDLEGIQPKRSSGTDDRKLVGNATCTIWTDYVNRRLGPLRKGEELTDKNKAELILGIGDAGVFLHAVYERLGAYDRFNEDFLGFVAGAKKNSKVKTVADRVDGISEGMKAMLTKYDLGKFKNKLDLCDKTTVEISAQINGNQAQYVDVQKLGQKLRGLGQAQDNAVSDCRRYVKAMRHEVSFVESSVPEVVAFVAAVRDKCAGILRRAHPKELLHSDSSAPRAHPDRDPDWR